MNIKVVYHSITGNTKKVAEAIASEAVTTAVAISEDVFNDIVDVMFIGDGNYGSNIHKKTKKFINALNPKKIKNVAIFGTYGGMNNALKKMKNLLKKNGLKVFDESFSCRGKAWGIINRKHPDDKDINVVRKFAQKIIKACK